MMHLLMRRCISATRVSVRRHRPRRRPIQRPQRHGEIERLQITGSPHPRGRRRKSCASCQIMGVPRPPARPSPMMQRIEDHHDRAGNGCKMGHNSQRAEQRTSRNDLNFFGLVAHCVWTLAPLSPIDRVMTIFLWDYIPLVVLPYGREPVARVPMERAGVAAWRNVSHPLATSPCGRLCEYGRRTPNRRHSGPKAARGWIQIPLELPLFAAQTYFSRCRKRSK
jgi:hypothetical protein